MMFESYIALLATQQPKILTQPTGIMATKDRMHNKTTENRCINFNFR